MQDIGSRNLRPNRTRQGTLELYAHAGPQRLDLEQVFLSFDLGGNLIIHATQSLREFSLARGV